jgi:hypothetical protein
LIIIDKGHTIKICISSFRKRKILSSSRQLDLDGDDCGIRYGIMTSITEDFAPKDLNDEVMANTIFAD